MQASYISLYQSGELERRADRLEARLVCCDICPRECRVDRVTNRRQGVCRSGSLPIVSSACAHHGEEPVLSGTRGSGTIFFGNCNLRCVFCQNHQISQNPARQKSFETDCRTLAEKMVFLQDELGCHNINFVSPTQFVPQIVRALCLAIPMGLHVPLVYNTNGYDSMSTLMELDGIIDIYLPDLKYASDEWARKLSLARDYVTNARQAIKEMYRQAGDLVVDDSEVAQRGVIVRHLILPNHLAGSAESLAWLAREVSPTITVSIMAQYFPMHRAGANQLISRTISAAEYEEVVQLLSDLGLDNGWMQDMGAPEYYVPDFDRDGHPFEPGRVRSR